VEAAPCTALCGSGRRRLSSWVGGTSGRFGTLRSGTSLRLHRHRALYYSCSYQRLSAIIGMKKARDYSLERRIEDENDEKMRILHDQVQEIQAAAKTIGHEVKSSNGFLGSFQVQMERGRDRLRTTVGRFDEVLQDKNNRLSIYVAGVVCVVFVIVWKFYL